MRRRSKAPRRRRRAPESAFYAALRKPGAAFCFPGQISPAVLGAWLNVRAPEGADAQWYVLALDGETVQLYLLGDGCYRAQTALSAETLAAELSARRPGRQLLRV